MLLLGMVLSLLGVFGAGAAPIIAVAPEWGQELRGAATCASGDAAAGLWIFEQWHFAPGLDTHGQTGQPQQENQTAIYRQLEKWISALPPGDRALVFAEGCEGEIDGHSTTRFNGWTLADLKGIAPEKLAEIPTHVPLRLESRFGERVRTLCIDDAQQIRAGLLAFSDARGVIGYADRLQKFSAQPDKVRPYLADVRQLYKLPENTTVPQAVARLKQELQSIVARIEASLSARNAHMLQVMRDALRDAQKRQKSPPFAALVIGGAHVADLVKKLDAQKWGCHVVRPVGYRDDAEALLQQLKQAVAGIQPR